MHSLFTFKYNSNGKEETADNSRVRLDWPGICTFVYPFQRRAR